MHNNSSMCSATIDAVKRKNKLLAISIGELKGGLHLRRDIAEIILREKLGACFDILKRKKRKERKEKWSYLMKSFLSTRMRMVAKNPVSNRTVTQELIIENQWTSKWCGRDEDLEYFSMRRSKGITVSFHLVEYMNSTSTSRSSVTSTTAAGSVCTLISITRSLLYRTSKWICLSIH